VGEDAREAGCNVYQEELDEAQPVELGAGRRAAGQPCTHERVGN